MFRAFGALAWRAVKSFKANQGLLLAGAVAYYALLSLVPLLILALIVLSHWIDQRELLQTLGRYLEWLVPGQSKPLVTELSQFMKHSDVLGWLLAITMLFFSSLAFSVLESAMRVIFRHRHATRTRHALISAVMPYLFVVAISVGLLVVTVVSSALQTVGEEHVRLFGREGSLHGISTTLLYLLGFASEVLMLTALYVVMPVGRLPVRHALIGGATAALLWEITRHILAWYYAKLSKVNVVYGSLSTAIVVLLSLEIAATLVLFGAQLIAEYEQMGAIER